MVMKVENFDQMWKLLRLLLKSHPWHGVEIGSQAPDVLTAYVEIVPTDTVKYEMDKGTGILKIDRPQRFSSICPVLYGFVPQTYCGDKVGEFCAQKTGRSGIMGDGDPLDICILSEKDITHGNILLQAIPIGGLRLIDGEEADDKLIAVMQGDAAYGEWRDVSECPAALVERLKHYFLTYKNPPDSTVKVCEITHVYGREEAHEVIRRSQQDYYERFGDLEGMLTEAFPD